VNLLSKILDLFDPAGWVFKIVAAALVAGALWFAWHEFKVWVSAPMVAAAVQAEQAKTAPVIKQLEEALAAQKAAAIEEKTKQTKAANEKTVQYNAVVKQNKELFAKFNAAMLSKSELADRLRNITEQSSAASTSDSGFAKRLGEAYAQCESDVSGLLTTASEQNERAAKAEAGLTALKQ
jgi:hypothetical protein